MSRLKVEKVQVKPLRPVIRDGLQNEQLLEKVITPGVYLVGHTRATNQLLDAWGDHLGAKLSRYEAEETSLKFYEFASAMQNTVPTSRSISSPSSSPRNSQKNTPTGPRKLLNAPGTLSGTRW